MMQTSLFIPMKNQNVPKLYAFPKMKKSDDEYKMVPNYKEIQ